jgi:small subunit ribosomal protein S3Ae
VDPKSKVACETATKDNVVMVAGEVTTQVKLDYDEIVRDAVAQIRSNSYAGDLSSVDGKKKAGDPFLKKEWYDIKAPSVFSTRNCGKTLVSRTAGTKIATEELKGRVLEVNLADLNNDEDQSYKKVKLCIEEVQGRNCLTDFHGMCLTRDKLCSLIRKWGSLIEAHVDVKTTDGYLVRMIVIGFTKRRADQVKSNCYAQSAQIRMIRRKMVEIMTNEGGKVQLCELVKKLIPEFIDKEIEQQTQSIFP